MPADEEIEKWLPCVKWTGEERDLPGVRGPEWVRRVLGPLDDPADGIVEIANP